MRSLKTTLAAAALAAVIYGAASAQPPGRRGGGMMGRAGGVMLLMNTGVQEELKLTDKQKETLREFSQAQQEKMREAFSGGDKEKMGDMIKEMTEAAEKKIKEVLDADQSKRFNQIKWQQAGVGAFNDKEVQTALKLTDDQKEKMKGIAEDMQKDMQELRREAGGGGGGGNFQELRTKMEALRKESTEKAEKVLTDDQKKSFKTLLGKPFELKMEGFGAKGNKGGAKPKGDGEKPKRGDGV